MTTTIIILSIIACILIGIIVVSTQAIRRLNTTKQNMINDIKALADQETERQLDLCAIKELVTENQQQVSHLETRKRELNEDITAQVNNVERLKNSFETTEEEFKKKYMAERKVWLDERQEEYLQMQEDFVDQFREDNKKKLAAAQELDAELKRLKSSVDAATEVAKRNAEKENFSQFHSIQLGPRALNDIRQLEDLVPSLSVEAGEAIAKVIWRVYYEKQFSDMVGRVVGTDRHTGIYKITNIKTQMCYVGQAVDIADRWRQHVKRALNAEPRTQNKLYPAMYAQGIQNFTFEIIEECEQSKLNEREDYWQDFYHAKEYGYSIK